MNHFGEKGDEKISGRGKDKQNNRDGLKKRGETG